MGASSVDEFPLLSALGLYAADIRGDGNCLFNALSDQLYGHQNEHATIRAGVIDYMRQHAEYYKQFIDVYPGGGIRRNPKRKSAGAYSTPANPAPPSDADIDRVFESHLESMAKGGTYGDNMEITAFSCKYGYDVKIYQRDFAYMVSGGGEDAIRPVAHIAYHLWEHYSSIRNLNGPHTGLPSVSPQALSPEEELRQKERLAQTSPVLPWQIDIVSKCLPFIADKPAIKRALETAKGDINLAVSNLLEADEYGSVSSRVDSSSVEREHDSDGEAQDGPKKKQDRRASRAARRTETATALSQLSQLDGSQESFSGWESDASSAPDSSQRSTTTQPTSLDEVETRSVKPSPRLISVTDSHSSAITPLRSKDLQSKISEPNPRGVPMHQKPSAHRITARDRKDMKKQAQKAARKARFQATVKTSINSARSPSPSQVGIALRARGMTDTPPVEILRTLYI